MTNQDEFHVKERITALHEARGKTITSRSLVLYWEALRGVGLDDFNAAVVRAMQTGVLGAHEIRALARDIQRDRMEKSSTPAGQFRCHAHEDQPDIVSNNPTVDWCDRCRHFVEIGRQAYDGQPGAAT